MNQHDYSTWECPHPTPQREREPIDWDAIADITPILVDCLCWILWLLFLLIPTAFHLHGTEAFSTANNIVFVLMGLVLCLAIHIAIQIGHGARAVFFACGLLILSYWF